jgi:hypothetical protein
MCQEAPSELADMVVTGFNATQANRAKTHT